MPLSPVEPKELAEIGKIARHIRERLAKSTLDSPQIAISREGWSVVLDALEMAPQIFEGLREIEALLVRAIDEPD